MQSLIMYRTLKKYKYQLLETCSFQIDIHPERDIFEPQKPDRAFIYLSSGGKLIIFSGYAWNGPPGMTLHTKNTMRASLVHDALYQLIRQRSISEEYRLHADKLLMKLCREDGMSAFRAAIVYKAARWLGEQSAIPHNEKRINIIASPHPESIVTMNNSTIIHRQSIHTIINKGSQL